MIKLLKFINKQEKYGDIEVFVGPPCQGFNLARKMQKTILAIIYDKNILDICQTQLHREIMIKG